MRLTSEVVAKAPSYINPIKDRELDLRGRRIPQIENLAVSKVNFYFYLLSKEFLLILLLGPKRCYRSHRQRLASIRQFTAITTITNIITGKKQN